MNVIRKRPNAVGQYLNLYTSRVFTSIIFIILDL
jgi:hypothetical protein